MFRQVVCNVVHCTVGVFVYKLVVIIPKLAPIKKTKTKKNKLVVIHMYKEFPLI